MNTPVVTSEEMKRLEKKAFDEGEDEQRYMENAGKGISAVCEEFLLTFSNTVYLLIGKGNNGGDAFVAGEHLLRKGFPVIAYHLYPLEECSFLSQKMAKRFVKAGGTLIHLQGEPTFTKKGIILDGLVGTGFQGAAKGSLAQAIEWANQSQLPIFAIDIPSGLNGNTGEVENVVIRAHTTLYLGLPKMGFYLNRGWNFVGNLISVDFGMPKRFFEEAKASAYLLSEEHAMQMLPRMERTRHKYQAGYVLAIAGSPNMPGAAMMACLATLKAGAGIVRLFYPKGMENVLTAAPYEMIKEPWDLEDDVRIFEEAQRARALFIGPGMGRDTKTEKAVKTILAKTTLPSVLDADALYFLAKDREMKLPETTILTPHHQEMQRILNTPPTLENCLAYVKDRSVTLVLKGAPTIIFHPHEMPLIISHGDPGMATAGTGDVLTGILAGLLAQGLPAQKAAALGVYLHALAGEIAAEMETSYGVIATDLITFLPDAIQDLLQQGEKK